MEQHKNVCFVVDMGLSVVIAAADDVSKDTGLSDVSKTESRSHKLLHRG